MKITVNVDGLEDVLNKLDSKAIEEKLNKAMDKIALAGQQDASMRYAASKTDGNILPYVGVADRGLLNKEIYALGKDVAFIEFGTGILNAEHPLQNEVSGIVSHGQYGKGLGADPLGWWYNDKRTIGIPAQRCLYETSKKLTAEIPNIVREVFND